MSPPRHYVHLDNRDELTRHLHLSATGAGWVVSGSARRREHMMTTQSHPPEVQYCAKEGCHLTAEDDCRQCRAESKPEYYCWGHSGGHPGHNVSLDPGHIPIVNVPT